MVLRVGAVEAAEAGDAVEAQEAVEAVEAADAVEAVEAADAVEAVEAADAVEALNALGNGGVDERMKRRGHTLCWGSVLLIPSAPNHHARGGGLESARPVQVSET
jgi:hypothetical protein